MPTWHPLIWRISPQHPCTCAEFKKGASLTPVLLQSPALETKPARELPPCHDVYSRTCTVGGEGWAEGWKQRPVDLDGRADGRVGVDRPACRTQLVACALFILTEGSTSAQSAAKAPSPRGDASLGLIIEVSGEMGFTSQLFWRGGEDGCSGEE